MQVLSDVELTRLGDDDLKQHFLSVRSKINTGRSQGADTKKLEMYYCYIVREINSR